MNPNGSMKGEMTLLHGKQHGEEIIFDGTGNIVERNHYLNGKPVQK